MAMVSGRPGNFVRIKESQYGADIAAAEARGRADSTTHQASPTAATKDQPSCPKCGTQQKTGAKFCPDCGTPVSPTEKNAGSAQTELQRMAGIDALAEGLDLPQLVTQMKQDGIPVSIAACEIVKALASRKAGAAGNSTGATAGDTAKYTARLEERVAKEQAVGRKISMAQAAAALSYEDSNDATAKAGVTLWEQVAKAKAQGRRIGLADAAAELEREAAADPTDKLGDAIVTRVEKAKAQGKKLSFAEAAEQVERQEAGGTASLATKLDDRIAKAKAEGRTIGPAQAMAELENLGAVR